MIKVDFHVHTDFSPDSLFSLESLARLSREKKVVPAITDHNSLKAHSKAREKGIDFIPGIEINTLAGHLIALYPAESIPRDLSLGETLDRIKEQGALAYLPHMYDAGRSGVVPEKQDIGKLDIVEIFNSRCLSSVFNTRAREFAEKHGLFQAAGSDAHSPWEFANAYTILPDFETGNPKELLKALKSTGIQGKPTPFYLRYFVSAVAKARKTLGLWNSG